VSIENRERASIIFLNHLRVISLILTLGAPVALHAGRAILECVADGWVARDGRFDGRTATLEAGAGRTALLDFRFSLISGWRVAKATLLVHVASGRTPDRVAIGAVVAPWKESDARVARPTRGRPAPVTVMEQGWIAVEVDPALVQLLAEGKARGLRLSASRDVAFHARESLGTAPYLVVEGQPGK
jgi:hypothetical protein